MSRSDPFRVRDYLEHIAQAIANTPPKHRAGRQIQMDDPDGNAIELFEPVR